MTLLIAVIPEYSKIRTLSYTHTKKGQKKKTTLMMAMCQKFLAYSF